MPSRLNLVEIEFLEDVAIGPFIAQRGDKCSMDEAMARSFGSSALILGPGQAESTVYLPGPNADLESASIATPANFFAATETASIQAAIDSLRETGGTVLLPAKVIELDATLVVYNNVCLQGVSSSVTIFRRQPGFRGPMILDYPEIGVGSSVGGKHILKDFQLDGNVEGVYKAKCTMTANSATLTAVDDFDGLAAGFFVEGEGIPEGTTCTSFDANAQTILMSAAVTNDAAFTATQRSIVYRPRYAVTATASTSSKVCVVTAGDMSAIVAGMMASGTNLNSDEDDLSPATRVASVDYVAGTITMDRNAKLSGSFALSCYVADDGILVAERFYNEDYDEDLEYRAPKIDGVQITQCSGNGITVRNGRDQFVLCNESKVTACYGDNVKVSNSNDSKIQGPVGIGTAWKSNLTVNGSSTFRVANFDIFDVRQADKYPNIASRGNRQFTLSTGECNGDIYIRGRGSEELNHKITLDKINFKWHGNDGYPDKSFPQYIRVVNAQISVSDSLFYGDAEDDSCPDRLFEIDDSTVSWYGCRVVTSDSEPTRPYKTEIYNATNGGKLIGFYVDASADDAIVVLGERADEKWITLTDEGTINTDASRGSHFKVTLGGDRTLANPTQTRDGQVLRWEIIQDGTGQRALTYGGHFEFLGGSSTPRLSPTPGAVDLIIGVRDDARGKIVCQFVRAQRAAWVQLAESSGSISTDIDYGTNFYVTLTGDGTLANPTHMYDGARMTWRLTQDATGSRTLDYGGKFRFPGGKVANAITGTANAVSVQSGVYDATADLIYMDPVKAAYAV